MGSLGLGKRKPSSSILLAALAVSRVGLIDLNAMIYSSPDFAIILCMVMRRRGGDAATSLTSVRL